MEVINHVLEQYLRACVHDHPQQWFKFLSLAEWSYNTSVHSGTGFSPFEIMYGTPPPAPPFYSAGTSTVEAVDAIRTSRDVIHQTLTRKLQKYQASMKRVADSHRRDLTYNIGDWVYVRLCPYRQTSLQPAYTKLSKRFYGPYRIQARVGNVAYCLQLPPTSKIHPVFHVSLLKAHHGPIPLDVPTLPPFSTANHPIVRPLQLLDWKMDESTQPPTPQVLVQWVGLAPEDTTWKYWPQLKDIYDLEDKVCFRTGGIDSNSPLQPITQEPRTDEHQRPTRKSARSHTRPTYLHDYE